ncbi:TPA: ead/Ea22-like family protein [Klebsiella pneumoniae]|nr:ead/Ea22-like family protein [Klebsiella pneumoniae]
MTDITELAQREKFEAWFVNDVVGADVNFPAFKDGEYTEGEIYDEQLYFMLQAMWMAWKAAGAEMVEALEKAQAAERRWHRVASRVHEQACESDVKIDELEAIRAAAEKLVRCKGRYHSEQNYRALAALFGVNIPDLPPLEHENVHYADAAEMEIEALRQRIAELESRTVKLPQRLQPGADGYDDWYVHSDDDGEYLKFDDVLAMLTAAGIKVEAE